MKFNNETGRGSFFSTPGIDFTPVSSPVVPSSFVSSSHMVVTVAPSVATPSVPMVGAVSLVSLPAGLDLGGWRLKCLLLALLETTLRGTIASTWLHGVSEYGTGETEEEAVGDLIDSLGEYLQSLEGRETRLADVALEELNHLRTLIEPAR